VLSIFRVLMVLALIALPRLALAQGAVVQAPGSVTQYDFACWYGNGVVFDCGLSSLSPVALPATPTGNLLGNATGSTTAAQVTPLTSLIDSICPGVAQGNLLIRDVAGWDCLGTGTNGFFLESQGFAANPTWANPTGTTYTAGTGLTLSGTAFSLTNPVAVGLGGTGLAGGASGGVLAYTGTTTLASSALLAQHGVMLGGGAGAVPYALSSLGTSGQVLTSNGASADPSWGSAGGSGTVTSIATNNGITGGTITATGTIGCIAATASTEGCVTPDGTSTHFLNGAGNWVAATNAGYVSLSTVAQVFTGGIYPTAFSNGTGSSGTKTIDCGNGPIQSLTNGGNFTLAMAPQDGSCVLRVTNNGSAGTITFSGFSEGTNTGDSLTTTNGNIFDISLTRIGGNPHRLVSALQ
jgi:hypothetical protein